MEREKEKVRVALTQSEGKLAGLEEGLKARGFEVVRAPLIETQTLPEARTRAEALLTCPWILFTSPAAVQAWRDFSLGFGTSKLGAVGEKTARALETLGAQVRLIGEPQNARGLAEAFLQRADTRAPVGLPQGDRALPTLQNLLENSGFETHVAVVYQTVLCEFPKHEVDIIVLASPSAVEALPETAGARAKLVALGPSTGAAIAENGWAYVGAERPDAEAIIDSLASYHDVKGE